MLRVTFVVLRSAFVVLLACGSLSAQTVTYRGFVDVSAVAFPQDAPNDSQNVIANLHGRGEAVLTATDWLQLAGGMDLLLNTHDEVEYEARVDIADRTARRPVLAIRRLMASLHGGPLSVDVGKQFIRWGKTDIVTPTDRFAPRDYLNVVSSEFLAVRGVRVTLASASDSLDVIWVPLFTPSRVPLFDQRWTVVPAGVPTGSMIADAGAVMPDGSQAGVRFARTGDRLEWSASFFNGFNHLPRIEPQLPEPDDPLRLGLTRRFSQMRMYGGDAAFPTRWFTAKAEAGYFTSSEEATDEYVLYVLQLERQTGEWLLIGGYAGEAVTKTRADATFAPDRGTAKSVLGRASLTIDAARSLAFEGAVRQSGAGAYFKAEYSQAYGAHWRATFSGAVIAGDDGDFLGQYHRNSHVQASLRYSF